MRFRVGNSGVDNGSFRIAKLIKILVSHGLDGGETKLRRVREEFSDQSNRRGFGVSENLEIKSSAKVHGGIK